MTAAPSPYSQGALVAGRYRLGQKLGSGGWGVVWEAYDVTTAAPVAVKILLPSVAAHPTARKRFLREARAASSIGHPSIVAVRDVLELDAHAVALVMDLLRGETLRQRLDRECVLSTRDAARILSPVAQALVPAHALGIVHRDLKPENVFLCSDGSDSVKVLDFGVAKLHSADRAPEHSVVTEIGVRLGTLHYMAPEQVLGLPGVDHRADIWSLGVLLYECLSGGRPIEGDTERDIVRSLLTGGITPLDVIDPDIPKEVTRLLDTLLERSPDERLGDAAVVAEALALLADAGSSGSPSSER